MCDEKLLGPGPAVPFRYSLSSVSGATDSEKRAGREKVTRISRTLITKSLSEAEPGISYGRGP